MGHSGPETGQGAIAAGKVDRLDVPGQSCDTREIWGRAARHVEIMAARGLRTNTQKDVARTIELMTHDVEAEWFTRLIGYVLANTEGAGGTIKNPVGFIKSELQKYDRSPADATLYDVPAPKQPAVKRPVALENGAHKSTRWLEWERDRVGPMPLDALEWYYANGQMSDEEYYRRGAEWNAWCDARRATKTPIAQSAPVAQTPEVITHAAPVDPAAMERHRAELANADKAAARKCRKSMRTPNGGQCGPLRGQRYNDANHYHEEDSMNDDWGDFDCDTEIRTPGGRESPSTDENSGPKSQECGPQTGGNVDPFSQQCGPLRGQQKDPVLAFYKPSQAHCIPGFPEIPTPTRAHTTDSAPLHQGNQIQGQNPTPNNEALGNRQSQPEETPSMAIAGPEMGQGAIAAAWVDRLPTWTNNRSETKYGPLLPVAPKRSSKCGLNRATFNGPSQP